MSKYTTTDDGHHIVIDGRKWRATDPGIPDELKVQLVAVLMDARRDVGKALRTKDDNLEKQARSRVSDAKIALGERGHPWWEPYDDAALGNRLKSTILTLLRHRDEGKSICPSEAARVVGTPDDWKTLMPAAREVSMQLAEEKRIAITRSGKVLDPTALGKGPIRLVHGELF